MRKSLITALILLGAISTVNAECIKLSKTLSCTLTDEEALTVNKLDNVSYKGGYNTNIEKVDVDLQNTKTTVYLNLKSYKYLKDLTIKKNKSSKAYIQLYKTVITIEDRGDKNE